MWSVFLQVVSIGQLKHLRKTVFEHKTLISADLVNPNVVETF